MSLEPVHISSLKAIGRSPAHYRWALDNRVEKKAFAVGNAVHSLVLGGKPVVVYKGRRAGNEWMIFQDENEGSYILSEKDYAKAEAMAESVLTHHIAPLWLRGQHEVHIEWTNCGRACDSTLDVLGSGFITDLKTTRSSDPNRFPYDARKMGYAAQIAWYQDAAKYLHPERTFEAGMVIAVESEPPYVVTPFELTARLLEQGRMQCRAWLEKLLACEASNEWPGYTQTVAYLDVQEDEDGVDLVFGDEKEDGDE